MKKRVFPFILIPFLLFYGLQVGAVEKKEDNWQAETIYYLMIDRFNNGDSSNDEAVNAKDPLAYHGGDFKGVTLQLDYIKDMGFTAICLSPIFDNEENGYHGYWVKDFYKPEEQFGTLASFKKLVKEAHKRDMKVIVEFPANSVGPHNPWLQDPTKQDWFHEKQEGKNIETDWIDGLPDLNQENPAVQAYLIDVAKWWVKETSIDGYKLDHAANVPTSFWTNFSKETKKVKPDLFLLGDIEAPNAGEVGAYSKTGIDGFLDYASNGVLRNSFAKPDQSTEELFNILEKNKQLYDSPNLMGTFMDNQRSTRFTHDAVLNNIHPGSRWKLALTYLFTTPGIPIVYYGSEIALEGGKNDDNRGQMDFRTDQDLVEYITKLGEVRNKFPSLTKGRIEPLYTKNGMTVYKREYKGEVTVVAINNTSKSQKVILDTDQLPKDKELRGYLNGDLVKSKNGKYQIIIDRDVAEVYELAEKSGLNIPYLIAMGIVYLLFIGFLFILIKRSRKKRQTK
ncbi:alpha-amylase family glycosyl hydrolase [Bacillus sp. 1NLA3E]|uniref:alpha-amylase family glycosyl hydrolase n=1 Tax=Bacillus sp. 1NLA3E TaxID=666686 RepID=UPI000247E722|nr:alpha-amylase family glycosyl hydrolase [Bacillus sp. 1NLA3E]AGK52691.1 alpha amylase [Bacillus sp. 1NLA3E]